MFSHFFDINKSLLNNSFVFVYFTFYYYFMNFKKIYYQFLFNRFSLNLLRNRLETLDLHLLKDLNISNIFFLFNRRFFIKDFFSRLLSMYSQRYINSFFIFKKLVSFSRSNLIRKNKILKSVILRKFNYINISKYEKRKRIHLNIYKQLFLNRKK